MPACVYDYVGFDNVVRFIEAFVESLDLVAACFDRALPKATGRPGYDPRDLLKLYIYGYLNRVRSSSWMTRIRTTQRPRRVWTIWKKRYPPSKTAAPALRHAAQSCKPAVRIRYH